ncbi:MAG: HD domain-containing protein [Oscillospiraceae bacterium]|nr:HD domain-containing protein [Oscillospiraceae bacterium]
MVYTELTNKALCYAYNAHHGQLDYNGIPFIFHPLHLAEQMKDEISCCAALLHDVVEDTELTLEDLRKEFPEEVVSIVALLTHEDSAEYNSEEYFDYIRAIKADPIAKKVKLADIAHNSDQTRCTGAGLPEEKLEYWKQKYQKALEILSE